MLKANAKAGNALVLQLDVNATQMCAEIAGLGIEFPCPLTHTHTHTEICGCALLHIPKNFSSLLTAYSSKFSILILFEYVEWCVPILCSCGGDGSLGEPPRRGDSQCGNMKLLLRQQQRVTDSWIF